MKKKKLFQRPLSRHCSTLTLVLSLLAVAGCSQETPSETKTSQATTSSVTAEKPALDITRITPEEAAKMERSILSQVNISVEDDLKVSLWASEKLLGDTVALNVDNQGRIWAAITTRSNNSEFDIRGVQQWEQRSMTFTNVEDRRKFLHEELATEKSDQNTFIPDRNKDGKHDWRDLAVNKEKVIRLEDTTGNGIADMSQVYLEDFNSEVTDVLGGVYYHNNLDELFLTVAPNAWRVKDTDGDGAADKLQALSDGFAVHIGFSGHGMSGMSVGPDGRIYYTIGDIGMSVTDDNGKKWHFPNQGVVVRSELDGTGFEVFAAGTRNIHEYAFDQYGNMISVDNDGDHVGEYERLVYLIDGSDTGWRTNWQLGKYLDPKNNTYKVWMDENYFTPRFEDQAAHILPPVAPYHAGPTGMLYNPGTALSDKWKNHFFVVEFVGSPARAGINAFTLQQEGASFKLETDRNIFKGILATGISWGPDGAIYASDWLEGWGLKNKGRIWKIDTPETAGNEVREDTRARLAEKANTWSLEQLDQLLDHADMRVRQKAQFELVERKATDILTAATNSNSQLKRIHAIWGLGQLARKDVSFADTLLPLINDQDAEIRAQVAKVLGDAHAIKATDALIPLLKDANDRVKFFAAQSLGRIGDDKAVTPIINMVIANNDKDVYLRHVSAIALERIGDVDALAALNTHSSEAVRIVAVVALKRLESPALASFLNDSSEFVVTNAARAISDDNFVTEAMPALAALLDKPRFTNEPLIRRVINANLYGVDRKNAERLISFATNTQFDGALRAEAIKTLAVWEQSSDFDRVTGQYRGAVKHNLADAQDILASGQAKLLADKSEAVREATVIALGDLTMATAKAALENSLHKDSTAQVRIAALQSLKKLNVDNMGDIVLAALKDKEQAVRLSALALLPELKLPVADVVNMHALLLNNGTVGEQQAAYLSIANVKDNLAYAVLNEKLDALIANKIAPEVQLELVTAAENSGDAGLTEKLAQYESSKDQSNPLEVYRESLLGGNADEGRNIFLYNSQAQCIRCHIVGSRGSLVGPELTNIANTIDHQQLLEAMVAPGARIAPGFGRITAILNSGEKIEGAFEKETATEITLLSSDKTRVIKRTDIAAIEPGVSGMPPMNYLLNKGQLRDLVAYLSTLKGEAEKAETH